MKKLLSRHGFIAVTTAAIVLCVYFNSCTGCEAGHSYEDSIYVEDVWSEDVGDYTYSVRKEIRIAAEGHSIFVNYLISKVDNETGYYDEWPKEVRIMAGNSSGPSYIIVSDTVSQRYYDVLMEEPVKEIDEYWQVNQNMVMYKNRVDFPTDSIYGGMISVFADTYLVYSDVKFVDPETGWTYEEKPVNGTKIVVDEVRNLQKPDKKLNNGKNLLYLGTYVRTLSFILDEKELCTSTMENDLYKMTD